MSQSVVEEQSWTQKVTDMVAKLAGVTSISWGFGGNWRKPHVVALADFQLPSVDAYTLDEGTKVFVNKRTYPGGPYELDDGRTIPAANVTMTVSSGKSTPDEGNPEESSGSGKTFYLGTVTETYRYEPPSLTIKKGGLACLEEEDEAGFLVRDASAAKFRGRVKAASAKKCEVGDTVPSHDTGPIELMCFELFPYAAMRAGLLSAAKFFQQLTAKRQESGSEDWAKFFGANLAEASKLTSMETERFDRGDMIIFYDGWDAGAHTVIASGQVDPSGGGHLVYSLSHSPAKNPGCWSIKAVRATFGEDAIPYAKAFTPRTPAA